VEELDVGHQRLRALRGADLRGDVGDQRFFDREVLDGRLLARDRSCQVELDRIVLTAERDAVHARLSEVNARVGHHLVQRQPIERARGEVGLQAGARYHRRGLDARLGDARRQRGERPPRAGMIGREREDVLERRDRPQRVAALDVDPRYPRQRLDLLGLLALLAQHEGHAAGPARVRGLAIAELRVEAESAIEVALLERLVGVVPHLQDLLGRHRAILAEDVRGTYPQTWAPGA